MATLTEIAAMYSRVNDALFQQVLGACVKGAWNIRNEDAGTANHANRLAWAAAILADKTMGRDKALEIYGLVLSNAAIQADPDNATDNDVEFVVNSFIDTVATGE